MDLFQEIALVTNIQCYWTMLRDFLRRDHLHETRGIIFSAVRWEAVHLGLMCFLTFFIDLDVQRSQLHRCHASMLLFPARAINLLPTQPLSLNRSSLQLTWVSKMSIFILRLMQYWVIFRGAVGSLVDGVVFIYYSCDVVSCGVVSRSLLWLINHCLALWWGVQIIIFIFSGEIWLGWECLIWADFYKNGLFGFA